MTKLFKLVAFLVTTFVSTSQTVSLHKDSKIIEKFKSWIEEFDIKSNNEHHLVHIFNNWLNNNKVIETTNSLNLSYTLGHNHYSGLNSSEFSELMGFKANREIFIDKNNGKNYPTSYPTVSTSAPTVSTSAPTVLTSAPTVLRSFNDDNKLKILSNLPQTVDWRIKNVVSSVKDQGQCGSCWAFSSTGALESAHALKYGNLKLFSEQQLVDCDFIKARKGGKNLGCNGGEMDAALEWSGKYGGLCTEDTYPYISGTTKTEGSCQTSCTQVHESIVKSVTHVSVNSDIAMMTALAQQPVSVAIEADQVAFQLYKSGVFTATCGANLDHGVLLVGYTENAYILKNSWSNSWGDNGYIYLAKGNDLTTGKPYNNGSGQCGVLMEGVYPNL